MMLRRKIEMIERRQSVRTRISLVSRASPLHLKHENLVYQTKGTSNYSYYRKDSPWPLTRTDSLSSDTPAIHWGNLFESNPTLRMRTRRAQFSEQVLIARNNTCNAFPTTHRGFDTRSFVPLVPPSRIFEHASTVDKYS